jgi:hypothetical protein
MRGHRQSITTQSDKTNNMHHSINDNHDEIVSRLNSKITQMKMNEDKLIEEINMLRSQ